MVAAWLMVAGLHAEPAHAACTFYSGNSAQTHTFTLPASLNVPRDASPGSVLYATEVATVRGTNTNSPDDFPAFASCTAPGNRSHLLISPLGATSGGSVGNLAQTNLQGIGLRFFFRDALGTDYRWGLPGAGVVTEAFIGRWGWHLNPPSFWGMEIVKTNNFAVTGTLDASDISGQVRLDGLLVTTLNITGTSAVRSQLCEAQADPVSLGNQRASNPGAVGSTLGMRDFTIALRNCPTGLTALSYQLRAVHGVLDASQAVAALTPGPDAASGFGIQITDPLGTPVTFGTSRAVPGDVAAQAGNYSIPLRAAYYRTATHVTHGLANSSIEFTVSYQ